MLSLKQIQDVCLINDSAKACRFLASDEMGAWHCMKKIAGKKKLINAEVSKYIANAKKNGQDPLNMGRPIGDNCSGYLVLKKIVQGYDVDSK